jgi:(p)ppGpp synthase/HD superfamily hydrolase
MQYTIYTHEQYLNIQKAIIFLYKSFVNVADRHKPELLHSLHVGYRLIDYGYPIDLVVAGFLHDVIEEGKNTDKLKKLFGKKVYELVMANTKDTSIEGWPAQYVELVSRTATYGEDALIIKAADVLDNFIFMFQTDNQLGKEKVTHLAKQIFKHTDSKDRVFGELHRVFKIWVKLDSH